MPVGYPPFVRDPLDVLIDRRLRNRYAGNGDTVLRSDALTPFEAPTYPVGQASMDPGMAEEQGQSFLSRLLGKFKSPEGSAALAAGLAPPRRGAGFLETAATSFGAGRGARARAERQSRMDKQSAEDEARKAELEERRVRAAETTAGAAATRAGQVGAGRRTRLEDLQGEEAFLRSLGWSDEKISDYYGTRGLRGGAGGLGGRGGSWKDRLAQSYLDLGRAADINEARMLAEHASRNAQQVGTITRSVMDPQTFNMTTTRVSVGRIQDPVTGEFHLVDAQGNELTPQDMLTFQGNPGAFQGGTGGPYRVGGGGAAAPGGGAEAGGGAPTGMARSIFSPSTGFNLPPEALPRPTARGVDDFQSEQPGITEDMILGALMSPGVDPALARLYAAGRGPMGNSTRIKAAAAAALGGGAQ